MGSHTTTSFHPWSLTRTRPAIKHGDEHDALVAALEDAKGGRLPVVYIELAEEPGVSDES
jgi:hypothetical protein